MVKVYAIIGIEATSEQEESLLGVFSNINTAKEELRNYRRKVATDIEYYNFAEFIIVTKELDSPCDYQFDTVVYRISGRL